MVHLTLLGWALMAGALLVAEPARAQQAPAADADKPARESVSPPPCSDCPGGGTVRSSPSSIVVTPEGKTIVPRTVIREQADFRLGDALRNVPGVSRR